MTSRFEEARAEEFRAARLAEQTEALKRWLEKNHPEIPFCGIAMVNAFMEEMGDAFLTAEAEDFEFALRTTTTTFPTQRVPTPAEVVAAENAHRKKLGVAQHRELNRIENPLPTRGALPQQWYGNDISTPAALKALAKRNIGAFKALVARFGADEVNKVLGVQPRAQVGRNFKMKF